jgi:pimeloyl-ACP methyl ester carboxylesterase
MPKALLKNGLRLHYQRVGKGPDVVMIHGLAGNLAFWHLELVSMLMDRFRILSYDLRGHGYSDMPPAGYSARDMASDLEELLDVLDVEGVDLVGHSFGADISLYFALLHPARVRKVVAIEAALPALSHERAREDWEGYDILADSLGRSGHPVPPEYRTDFGYLLRMSLKAPARSGPLNGLPRDPEPFLKLLETTTMLRDYEDVGALSLENIPRIRVPVVLAYVEGSPLLGTYRYLRDNLPDASTIILPHTELGHLGPLVYPGVVAKHLVESLSPARPATGDGLPSARHTPVEGAENGGRREAWDPS